jgi:hypothetical protein
MATVITFGRVRRRRGIVVVLIVESVFVPHAHFKLLTLNEELFVIVNVFATCPKSSAARQLHHESIRQQVL